MNARKDKSNLKGKSKVADIAKSGNQRLLQSSTGIADSVAAGVDELIAMIEEARVRVWTAVNSELVTLYWSVGRWLSRKCAMAEWGDKTILSVARQIAEKRPDLKGFSRPGLYRMRQFYEYYKDDEFVSPLVRQIDWTHHLIVMARAKSPEERRFYLEKCAAEHCSKRDLERLFDSSFYERHRLGEAAPHSAKASGSIRAAVPDIYALEFLDLPERHREATLRDAIVSNMRDFILELGRDFSFVGKEYPVKVGKCDFNIDLLFFNRVLRCFFAFELKTRKFRPSDIGQLDFYLEALDRDVRRDGRIQASVSFFVPTRTIRWWSMRFRAVCPLPWLHRIKLLFQTRCYCRTDSARLPTWHWNRAIPKSCLCQMTRKERPYDRQHHQQREYDCG